MKVYNGDMKTVKVSYFDSFKCIADKCPSTCCQGWQIIDDDGVPLPLKDKKCVYLNPDGLCKLVLKGGEEAISYTCHMYPRHVEEFDGLREWSLSLSCPEAVRMIIENAPQYTVTEDEKSDPLADDYDDFDYMLFSALEEARDIIFGILGREDLSFNKKACIALTLSKKLQECFDEGEEFKMDEILASYKDEKTYLDIQEWDVFEYYTQKAGVLSKLEVLSDDWNEVLKEIPRVIKLSGDTKNMPAKGLIFTDKMLSRLLESYLYAYFLGTVYDNYIYAMTKMCVFSVVMCDRISSVFDFEDKNVMIYRYAREIEHSDDNIACLLQFFDEEYT